MFEIFEKRERAKEYRGMKVILVKTILISIERD
jgi:hypothetical protein